MISPLLIKYVIARTTSAGRTPSLWSSSADEGSLLRDCCPFQLKAWSFLLNVRFIKYTWGSNLVVVQLLLKIVNTSLPRLGVNNQKKTEASVCTHQYVGCRQQVKVIADYQSFTKTWPSIISLVYLEYLLIVPSL